MTESQSQRARAPVIDAAIFAQAHLDQPLPLTRLADAAGLSPHHFHRIFRQTTGETPAQYVQRLRLEKAAFNLLLHNDSVLSIALDCGFTSHETMIRAFRRKFDATPTQYRAGKRLAVGGQRAEDVRQPMGADHYSLTRTTRARLEPLPVAFLRHLGPYEEVDQELWSQLAQWADARGLPSERMLIGVGHDAPALTPTDKLRFDACITVPEGTAGNGLVRITNVPPLLCALTTHVGAYATLPKAYRQIYQQTVALDGYEIVGLPAIEIYRDSTVETLRAVSTTDIYLPIRRKT